MVLRSLRTPAAGATQIAENLLGPYEAWMFDAGKYFDLPGLMLSAEYSLSCVAEFERPIDPSALLATTVAAGPDGIELSVRVPDLYCHAGFQTRFVPFVLTARRDGAGYNMLQALSAADVGDLLVTFRARPPLQDLPAARFRFNLPIRHETLHLSRSATPQATASCGGAGRPKAIVAIIDQGIPFAHRRFRSRDDRRTRIDYCWAQSAAGPGNGPLFGREFRAADIDDLIESMAGDEDAIYRAAGMLGRPGEMPQPLARTYAHGAHVLDTFAGSDAGGDDLRIIAVDLPATSTWDTSGFGKDMFILSALHYILARAHDIAAEAGIEGELPLVLNMSYGISGGPHDGTGLLEAAFDELVAGRRALAPTFLTLPSGNSFHDSLFALLTDRHFAPSVNGGPRTAELKWFVPPADRTSTYLELWFPDGVDPAKVRVWLIPPGSERPANGVLVANGPDFSECDLVDPNARVFGQFSLDRHRQQRWRCMAILAPTEAPARPMGPLVAAPAGVWTIRVEADPDLSFPETLPGGGQPLSGGLQFRLQRDESFGQGQTGARQSYFLDPEDFPFDQTGAPATRDRVDQGAKVRRFGSINGLVTGETPFSVGGYIGRTSRPAPYSSAGVTAGAGSEWQALEKPVGLSGLCERSTWSRGIRAAGTRSGTTVALGGTSSAAPQVARQIADLARAGHLTSTTGTAEAIAALGQAAGWSVVGPAEDGGLTTYRLGAFRVGGAQAGDDPNTA